MKRTSADAQRKRLRIFIVEPSGLFWGSERALVDLVQHVDLSRYEIIVACPLSARLREHLAPLGVRLVEGDIGMLHRRGRVSRIRAFLWLAAVIRREKPDVVHVNEAGFTALVAAARLGRHSAIVTHVRLWEDAVMLANGLPRRSSPQLTIAISDFIARRLRERPSGAVNQGLAGSSIRVIFDPFDADAFEREPLEDQRPVREELGFSQAQRIVLMVGRICREKGQALLLDAAERLTDEHTVFLFVGGVPPGAPAEIAYHTSLLRRTATPLLAERIKFVGNRDDVARLMMASDVVVMASANEPFGRVLLEALSLGKPVVGPNRGGPAEIIGDNERGYLFTSGDAGQLADSIREVLASPLSASERAMRGKTWVRRECSPWAHASRVQELWDEASAACVARR